MNRSGALLACLAGIWPLFTHAGWIDRSGRPVPDAPDRQSSGDFGAQLLLTDSADEFRKIWNSTTGTLTDEESGRTVTLHAPFTLIK